MNSCSTEMMRVLKEQTEALKETDEDGKPTGRTLGEAAQLNANAAAQAKAEAEKEKDQANTSLSNTWDNYYGIKRLVDNLGLLEWGYCSLASSSLT